MANTITTLSYANTFGDWVVITDLLSNEVNSIGFGNYVKSNGLITLAGSGTGLQVANNSLFQGNVLITGAGQALRVTNDAVITGNLSVGGNVTFSGFEVDYQDITSNTIHANTITVYQNTIANVVIANTATINRTLSVGSDATITGNLTVLGNTNISLNEIVTGSITANALYGQANVQIMQEISDSANASVGTALAFSIALG